MIMPFARRRSGGSCPVTPTGSPARFPSHGGARRATMTTSASTYTLGGMNTIEVRELVHFTTVADALHFGAAAERLGISQPPLSRSIARLERRLGFALFHRTTRRISLTPAGEVFLADCLRLLSEMDGAIRRAQQVGRAGSLNLAVRPGAGQSVLTGLLNAYAELPESGP